ncbi:MAG: phenylacetate--CoA ligase [Candidatus Euphemobacter frigidus]|nr:phenylacetate--CoA ligase [Candidatus Euphemobacter frigidus]MDP8275682.1 phenylacetate--CoA ligase [Candidatus Euphemobacter frigidus]
MYWSEEIETIGRKELEKLQLRRLRTSLRRAASSRFYRELFQNAAIKPEEIRSLKDLTRLPFTTKADLRHSYPGGMLAVDPEKVVRIHASSGTTGQSTVVYHTAHDLDGWTDLVTRCLVMAGCTPRDIFQNMMSYGLFTGGLGLHYGAERLGMMVIPVGGGNTDRQIQFFRDFGTTVIHITPSYALHLNDVIKDMGLSHRDFKLRLLIFGAEPYSEATRAKIVEAYRVDTYNCYGLSEMNGPGVAFECGASDGMHVWEDNYIVEVIDPESGESLPPGKIGEVVLTTLNREAMPLIRYRTRDLAFLYEDTSCPCGRNFRRLSRIVGRADDMLIVRGVNVFPSQVEQVLMKLPEVGTNYQLLLDRVENLDRMTVRVEISGRMFHGEVGELRALRKKIQHELKEQILLTTEVELMEPGALPPSRGKAKRVIDNREI